MPLALGFEAGLSLGEVLAAQVAACEVMGRLGMSCFFGPQNGQQLPFIHQVGAAVAAGRLLGLSEDALTHALGIALSQPPAPLWPAFLGPFGAKILVASDPAVAGLRAAELAAAGMTAAEDLLDHEGGFFSRFAFAPLPAALSGLGETWVLDTLHLKPWPACAYHQAVYALLDEYLATHPTGSIGPADSKSDSAWATATQPRDVVAVTIETTALAATVGALADRRHECAGEGEGLGEGDDLHANDVTFSLTLGPAVALLAGGLTPDALASDWLARNGPAVRRLAERVRVVHDVAMTEALLREMEERLDLSGALRSAVGGPVSLLRLLRDARRAFPGVPLPHSQGLTRLPVVAARALARLTARRPASAAEAWNLGDRPLEGLRFPFAARVTVHHGAGEPWTGELSHPPGALADPDVSLSDLARGKLVPEAARHVPEPQAASAAAGLHSASTDTPISDVVAPLIGTPAS